VNTKAERFGLLLLLALSFVRHSAVHAQTRTLDDGLNAFLTEVEAAQVELVRGRPDAFKTLWSHADDVTLIGGLGGAIAKGWESVSTRLDWVATQYTDGRRTHEETSRLLGPEFAVVVQSETIQFRVPGEQGETVQLLRATMVMRLEAGAWRIVHRHADAQTVRQTTR
jgi:hypothetical protein